MFFLARYIPFEQLHFRLPQLALDSVLGGGRRVDALVWPDHILGTFSDRRFYMDRWSSWLRRHQPKSLRTGLFDLAMAGNELSCRELACWALGLWGRMCLPIPSY